MRVAAVVFGITSAAMLGSMAVIHSTGERVLQLERQQDKQRDALLAIDDLFSMLLDAETGQRGFLITHDESYLEPFVRARARLPEAFARFGQTSTVANPTLDIKELRRLVDEKMAELTHTIEVNKTAGFEAASSIVRAGTGKETMDRVRALVTQMRNAQVERLRQEIEATQRATRLRNALFAVAGAISILVLIWGFLRIRRAILERNAAVIHQERQADLLSTTLASIGDCVIVTDTSGRITFMNAVAAALTGWDPAEASGRPIRDIFRIINEHSRQPVEDPVEKVIQQGVIIGLANHTLLIRKDGSEVPIDDSGAPIRSISGELEGVVLVFRDFSGHKNAERELRQAKEAAEIANETKDKFLAMLSHELRTPMTPVVATLNLWEMSEDLPAGLRDDVVMMRRNLDLEARIIDDLLDLTRVSRGMLTVVRERVDVHSIIKLLLDFTRGDIDAKNVTVIQRLDASRHFVLADPARLQQVLWNLLRNAVNFTEVNGSIVLRTTNDGDRLAISVQDSGIGMTPETIEKLFVPFEQADEQRSRRYGGLGLGLAISHALMNVMGGTLKGESAGLKHGSTFTVTLDTVDQTTPVDSRAPPPIQRSRQKILIVEDHLDTAMALTRLLQMRGHDVRTAASVASAGTEIKSHPFDLIICDIGLPDGTGYDVISEIKKNDSIPSIALTGFGMSSDVERAIAAGFAAHLTKPVNFLKLEAIIADLSSRKRVS